MTRKQRIISTGIIGAVAVLLLLLPEHAHKTYHTNQGKVFGTYYAIQYESAQDLHDSIRAAFAGFDASMSL